MGKQAVWKGYQCVLERVITYSERKQVVSPQVRFAPGRFAPTQSRFAPTGPFRPRSFRPNSESFRPSSKLFRPNLKLFRPNFKVA